MNRWSSIAGLLTLVFFNLNGRGIDTTQAVAIGGMNQWIQIKAQSDKDPVILILHGGPGNSMIPYAGQFIGELQKKFIVVLWDQRESGKTATLNSSPLPLTLDLFISDTRELIDYLSQRFSKNKIYLAGHSWGGFLALCSAGQFPEKLEACFAISPMVNQTESERLSLELMKGKATETHNRKALAELEKVAIPFRTAGDLYIHRFWLARFSGNRFPSRSYIERWSQKWLAVWLEASGVNLFTRQPVMHCPVYFLVGNNDHQTDAKLTEEYEKVLKAEEKDLFWFTHSGHNLNLTESAKFQEIIISHRTN